MTRNEATILGALIATMFARGPWSDLIVTVGWQDDGTDPEKARDWFVRVDSAPDGEDS